MLLSLLFACEPEGDKSPGGGDTGAIDTGTGSDSGDTPLGDDLLVSPGPEGTVSYEAARGTAWCRDNWQADARLVALMYYETFGTQAVYFSPSDPDNNCQWSAFPGGDATTYVVPNAQYAPGWTYDSTADYIPEWRVDDVDIISTYGLDTPIFFALNTAQHRRQYGWEVDLDGVADNVPVILAGQSITGPEYFLVNAITGERYNRDSPDDSGETGDTGDTGPAGELPYPVVATTSDGANGMLVYIDPATGAAEEVMAIDPSARVRAAEGYVLLLSPEPTNTLEVYSVGDWSAPVLSWDLGAGSDPYDVNYCSGDLVVSLAGRNRLVVIDPDGGADTVEISLDAYADGDGNADPGEVVCPNNLPAVALARHDDTLGRSAGGVVVQFEKGGDWSENQSWSVVANAAAFTGHDDEDVAWVTGGNPGEGDGRVDLVDLSNDQSWLGVLGEPAIGGRPVYATAYNDARGLLVVEAATGAAVSCVDLAGWTTSGLATPGGTVHPGAIGSDGTAWLPYGAGSASPGVTAYNADTCTEGSSWATRLPATGVALVE